MKTTYSLFCTGADSFIIISDDEEQEEETGYKLGKLEEVSGGETDVVMKGTGINFYTLIHWNFFVNMYLYAVNVFVEKIPLHDTKIIMFIVTVAKHVVSLYAALAIT